MSLTSKQCVDMAEAVIGKRTAMLTITEFAQITNRDRREVWKDCVAGVIKAHQHGGLKGHWRIPVSELADMIGAAS